MPAGLVVKKPGLDSTFRPVGRPGDGRGRNGQETLVEGYEGRGVQRMALWGWVHGGVQMKGKLNFA